MNDVVATKELPALVKSCVQEVMANYVPKSVHSNFWSTALCFIGLSIVSVSISIMFRSLLQSAGKQPEAIDKLRNIGTFGAILIETIALIMFVVFMVAKG